MKEQIPSPSELFAEHNELVYARLIDQQKLTRFNELLHEFSRKLYDKIDNEAEGRKVGTQFYTSEICGFTVKMSNVPTLTAAKRRTIAIDEIYFGTTNAGIGPFPSTTMASGENAEIIQWFDPCLRQYLSNIGWRFGILFNRDRENRVEKIIVYSYSMKK